MKKHTFLIAIGTDELPPKNLKKLGTELSNHIIHELKKNNINYNNTKWFAAPRHLAVKTNIIISEKYSDSINNNIPNYFHKKNTHIINDKIKNINSNTSNNNNIQQKYVFYKKKPIESHHTIKKDFKNLLLKIIHQALEKLINYKMMRWSTVCTPFIRPVNTITILLDSNLISGRFFDINVDRIIYGHRYIKNNAIVLQNANDYPDILSTIGYVIVDYDLRKNILKTAITKQASKLGGFVDTKNEEFLEEITSSIEWPIVLSGKFDKKFLILPKEVIIHIMQKNQKYFPIYNIDNGILLPHFIFVINAITHNYSQIIASHENIIKTRFMDAEFFLKNDSKFRLEEYVPQLNSILFHRKLGSIRDKTDRIIKLSEWIANQINEDILQTKRAGYLCKCDLVSDMVREFPDLQGTIGMYYAQRDGESKIVALAQKEHYQPKFTNDTVPKERISCIISIADKMDTISGIFSIEQSPTNNKDPFALKRNATSIFTIIIQQKLSLNFIDLIHKSIKLYELNPTNFITVKHNIYQFMRQRLQLYFFAKGYEKKIIKSVLNINNNDILACNIQIYTINNFYKFKEKEYNQIFSIYKRTSNLLKTQASSSEKPKIQNNLLTDPKEINLFHQIIQTDQQITLLIKHNDYEDALTVIKNLSQSAQIFLDNVIVMEENKIIRKNRLNLLNTLNNTILRVINFTALKP